MHHFLPLPERMAGDRNWNIRMNEKCPRSVAEGAALAGIGQEPAYTGEGLKDRRVLRNGCGGLHFMPPRQGRSVGKKKQRYAKLGKM
jgi:hypothetical protein